MSPPPQQLLCPSSPADDGGDLLRGYKWGFLRLYRKPPLYNAQLAYFCPNETELARITGMSVDGACDAMLAEIPEGAWAAFEAAFAAELAGFRRESHWYYDKASSAIGAPEP